MGNQYHIAILHYKTIEKTVECVNSIIENVRAYHILIIDNHSNDGTVEKLQEIYSENSDVEFLLLNENLGFAKANNCALNLYKKRNVKYAILANNDIVFKKNAIEKMITDLSASSNLLLVAPRIEDPSGNIQNSVQVNGKSAFTFFLYSLFPGLEKGTIASSLNNKTIIKQFSGSCFACNICKMNEIGNFDENTFLYYEEAIISAKARKNNLSMIYEPNATVIHYHGATTKSINYMIHFYMMESEAYYLTKYLRVNMTALLTYLRIKSKIHYLKYHSGELYQKEKEIIKRTKELADEKH